MLYVLYDNDNDDVYDDNDYDDDDYDDDDNLLSLIGSNK